MKNKMTFWSLIAEKDYIIEIPKIQRDYVQGRNAANIQASFDLLLEDIKNALYENKPLDLNFIYGKVVQGSIFIPIDGQQRLTTLFLLHTYGWIIAEDKNEYNVDLFKKFKYETRSFSKKFLEAYVEHLSQIVIGVDSRISDIITDEYWFQTEWLSDPTVFSMLTALNQIQKRFNKKADLLKKLTKGNVRFQFLETNDIGDEEDLYIKLNARGRLLSDFENLKSEIEEALQGGLQMNVSDKMDGYWRDYFWNLAYSQFIAQYDDSKKLNLCDMLDKVSILFFHWFFYCKALLGGIKKEKEELLRNKRAFFRLEDYDIDIAEAMAELEVILDKLSNDAKLSSSQGYDEWLISCLDYYGDDVIFEDIVKFWAYLLCQKHTLSDDKYVTWRRVAKHLTENSEFNEKTISNAIRSIYVLDEFTPSLLSSLSSGKIDPGKLAAINVEMVKEEIRKAKLIEGDNDWKPLIYDAEDTIQCLNGQITALLDFSNEDMPAFKVYADKFNYIFDKNGVPDSSIFLFRRALLTFGDYSLNYSSYLINPDKTRYRDWRSLLNSDNGDKRNFFKLLLDALDINKDLNSQLNTIIKSFTDTNASKYIYIRIDGVMDYMKKGMFRCNWWAPNRTLLVPGQMQNGKWNAEDRTYAIYCMLNDEGYPRLDPYEYGWSYADIGVSVQSGKIKVISNKDDAELLCLHDGKEAGKVKTFQEGYDFIKSYNCNG